MVELALVRVLLVVGMGRPAILLLGNGHVGPVEGAPTQEHVPDQCLDGGLAYEPDKEQLFDDLRGDGA